MTMTLYSKRMYYSRMTMKKNMNTTFTKDYLPYHLLLLYHIINCNERKKNTHTIQSTILNMYLWPCVVPLSFSCFERHKLYVLCTYIHHLPPNHCIHFCIVLRDSNNKKKSLGEESIFVWKEINSWNYIRISSIIIWISIWLFPRLW